MISTLKLSLNLSYKIIIDFKPKIIALYFQAIHISIAESIDVWVKVLKQKHILRRVRQV